MSSANSQSDTKVARSSRTRDMQDARPLLQAICLGVFLAAVLTAAAALAGPEAKSGAATPETQTQQAPSVSGR